MKIKNSQFGEIEYDEKIIVNFSEGMIGFEKLKKFLLINKNDGLFLWLTSVEEPEIVFPLFAIDAIYDNFPHENNFEVFGIVKLDREPENITVNLKAPVYINVISKAGFQKIIDSETYSMNYKLFKKE